MLLAHTLAVLITTGGPATAIENLNAGESSVVLAQAQQLTPQQAEEEAKQRKQRDERKAQEKAKADQDRARAEQERAKAAQDRAKAELEKQKQERARDQDRTREAQEKQQREQRAKAAQEKAKAEQDRAREAQEKQQREERAKTAQEKAKTDQDRARTEQERAKAAQDKSKADLEKREKDAQDKQQRDQKAKAAQDRGKIEDRSKQERASDPQKKLPDAASRVEEGRLKEERAKLDQDRSRIELERARLNAEAKQKEQSARASEEFKRREDRLKGEENRLKAADEQLKQREERTRAELDRQRSREGGLQERRDQLRERDKQLGRAERHLERLGDIQKQRTERVEQGRRIIEEPDRRVIVKDQNKASIIRHDETERLKRVTRDFRSERRGDGITVSYFARTDGGQVISEVDDDGRLLRRYRRMRDGREVMLIDNRRSFRPDRPRWFVDIVDLPPIAVRIPRDRYVMEYSRASDDDLYDTIAAEPLEPLTRRYSLEEVRWSNPLRERMRRVDLDDINFEFGSWEITPDQMPKLERVASAIKRLLDRKPDEVLLIEGYTDAVGSEEDNLTLSDRRAEAVATVLTQYFDVPPENLVTQGYGEQFLKVDTQLAERLNRRVALRRITPFLERDRG